VATLYKRGDAYYLNWYDGGQQFRTSLGKVEKREAESRLTEKIAELRGLITPTRGVTVGSILKDYEEWYEKARPTTYKRAHSALKRFRARFDDESAEGLHPSSIERWVSQEKALGQAEKALKLARAAFRRALSQRRIKHSPMDGVTIPKSVTSRAPEYFQPNQLRKLARAEHGAIWQFMWNTGIRRGEMAKARRQDVRDKMLYVESLPEGRTKNARWRAIPLNPAANRALKKLGKDKLVDVHPDTLSDWFSAETERGTLHWLRHTFCTALVQSGVSLHEVKRLAGHSSITVTERYAHHAPGFGRDAISTLARWTSTKTSTAKPRKRRKTA
jgi:integrase